MTTSNNELKREVREVFGVALTDDEVETAKGRLPNMVANVRLLDRWAAKLGGIGPASIQRVVE